MSYQHVVVTAKGGPEVLQLVTESALPEPGPGEVRVKVLAVGTGFTDTAIRRGNYPDVILIDGGSPSKLESSSRRSTVRRLEQTHRCPRLQPIKPKHIHPCLHIGRNNFS